MIYKFKSKASGDVLMLQGNGDMLLRIIGREPATKGIIEVSAMSAARAALQEAVAAEEAQRAKAKVAAHNVSGESGEASDAASAAPPAVSLRARVWPMVDMLERASRAKEPIVWGV